MSADPERQRETIRAAMQRARTARSGGDTDAVLTALREAWSEARALRDASLIATTSWRLAKAEHDIGHPRAALEALRPLIEDPALDRPNPFMKAQPAGPFDHQPQGLRALEPLTRRFWDREGYGEPLVLTLWEAAAARHREDGDPFLAAWADVQRAWALACTGRLDDLQALTLDYVRVTPHAFGEGPHRHPEAPDTPASVFWVQRDLARTLLRAATWRGEERLAWEASELLEDAMEETESARHRDFWYLDATLSAADAFGWEAPLREQATSWHRAAAARPDDDPHRSRVEAIRARHEGAPDRAREAAARSAARATDGLHGPEWAVLSWLEAARSARDGADEADLRARAEEAARRWSVHAFLRANP